MSSSDDVGGCVGAALMAAFGLFVLAAVVTALFTVGSFFGAGVAVRNYFLALREHVALERPAT